jgi:hypothetical protein
MWVQFVQQLVPPKFLDGARMSAGWSGLLLQVCGHAMDHLGHFEKVRGLVDRYAALTWCGWRLTDSGC